MRDASDLRGVVEWWLPELAKHRAEKPIMVHRWRCSGWLHARQLRDKNWTVDRVGESGRGDAVESPPRVLSPERGSANGTLETDGTGETDAVRPLGNAFAVREETNGSFKCEFGVELFGSRDEARTLVFEYVEVFSSRVRRHSSLGCITLDEYE